MLFVVNHHVSPESQIAQSVDPFQILLNSCIEIHNGVNDCVLCVWSFRRKFCISPQSLDYTFFVAEFIPSEVNFFNFNPPQ